MSGISFRIPEIACSVHEGEIITNFCCLQSCLQGLCPECIDDHYKSHRERGITAELDTLKTIVQMCEKHLIVGINGISEQIYRLESNHRVGPEEVIKCSINDLNKMRKQFHDAIDRHFDAIQKNYIAKVNADVEQFYDFQDLNKNMNEILAQLQRLLEQLRTPQLIDSASKTARLNIQELIMTYRGQVDGALGKNLHMPELVDFNDGSLKRFEGDLGSYVS